ncbi:MAG: DUF6519 domain-containing protein [Reinekea sp.]|nr:DUF6519 domain-containing protein [Reinekea sp.]
MKGNFSRDSYRPSRQYSGVYQVQGGMVTDADLGEQSNIAQKRTDGLGEFSVGSGVPDQQGAVVIAANLPALAEGVLFAEGVRGMTQSTGPLSGPLSLYAQQPDFPLAPTLPTTGNWLLYADVWHRTVTPLEDEQLTDPGLHGAETSLRQRTTTQIKYLPLAEADTLGLDSGRFPKQGLGRLTVTPVDPETISDDCDPCADVVAAEQTVSNGLFRIEILQVTGHAQSPGTIRIAWSDENASATAVATVNSEDFSRAGAVYEFYADSTEKHLGVHHDTGSVACSTRGSSLANPEIATAPDGETWPYVRRWSGIADVDFTAQTVDAMGSGSLEVSGRSIQLTTDAFTADIDLTSVPTVAGDYWLIETRRFAETPIRAVSETPVGVEHFYCPLFRIADGDVVPLSDDENRRLSFPTLADMPASHIQLDNHCTKLYGDAENVQQALDNLCGISAADIAFDPSGCKHLYDSTDNVQDALNNLCKVDFGNEKMLRLLHDWGVICGVFPSLRQMNSSVVRYTSGAILDRMGHLGSVEQTDLDLNKLLGSEFFHFSNLDEFDSLLSEKKVCLALSVEAGGIIRAHLATKEFAFGPQDPTFLSTFQACMEKNKPYGFVDHYKAQPANNKAVLDKVIYGAGKPKLAANQRLDKGEQIVARQFNDELVEKWASHTNDAEGVEMLRKRIQQIDKDINPDGATGEVREARFMMREALVYQAINESDEERIRRCLCKAVMPSCPTPGEAPYLVPIACLRGRVENGQIRLSEVCAHACRKQAMSWRWLNYFMKEVVDNYSQRLAEFCCPPPAIGQLPDGPIYKAPDKRWHFDPKIDFKAENYISRIDDGLRLFSGKRSPSEFKVKVDVNDLGIDQAKVAFKGNGIEVAETIDIGDAQAIARIKAASAGIEAANLVLDAGDVAPGDKVALIVSDGVAVDYVKLETGGGKFLYQTATQLSAGTELSATDTGMIDADIVSADLIRLREEKELLSQDVNTLNASLDQIRKEREQIQKDLSSSQKELAALAEQQKAILTETAKERAGFIESLRKEVPVTAVTKDNELFATNLAKKGITNLGALANVSDTDLRVLARTSKLSLATARQLKRDAAEHIASGVK